ncbi:secondary thiamine-phosphate synthase enzyme YjbQ [Candidatus Riflebacteria bacterium]
MAVICEAFNIDTGGFCDIHDITPQVRQQLNKSGLKKGVVTVFVPGSTASITTIEYESGVIEDLKKAIERIAPQNMHYAHDARWGDGNGFSHVRSALLGPSINVPFSSNALQLGPWQQIVFIDFDNRPRERKILLHLIGE